MAEMTETPYLRVDRDVLKKNIQRMQKLAEKQECQLHPHAKTHKSVNIARLQMGAGAAGITCAKVSEAEVFMAAGIPSVLVAYPLVVPEKVNRLMAAARRHRCHVRTVFDSETGIGVLDEAARRHGVELEVLLKIDVGLHRCGIRLDEPRAVTLAQAAETASMLRFRGLLSHAGHAYGAGEVSAVKAIAEQERRDMLSVKDQIVAHGFEVPEVSVGATPTVLVADNFDGITEIRPGNYVFMDMNQVRLGVVSADRVALNVVATVVSRNAQYCIIDAGSKTLSSDTGAHGSGSVAGYGRAYPMDGYLDEGAAMDVVKLSEEHGFIRRRKGEDLKVGERVRIIPNHACSVVNLARTLTLAGATPEPGFHEWPVDASGCVK